MSESTPQSKSREIKEKEPNGRTVFFGVRHECADEEGLGMLHDLYLHIDENGDMKLEQCSIKPRDQWANADASVPNFADDVKSNVIFDSNNPDYSKLDGISDVAVREEVTRKIQKLMSIPADKRAWEA